MIYYIYKIVCEDTDYTYVGSTRAFKERKYQHKSCCNNENRKEYNFKLYKTIRENGGWDNWRMVCIAQVEVESKRQAEIIEEEWRMNLQANLNGQRCYRTEEQMKEYHKEYYENNTEKITQYKKEYRENNTEKIKEWVKTKCNCECGGRYTNAHKSQHFKSIKHQKYLNENKDL